MKGMFQTLVQRAISSGLYFPLEDIFRHQIAIVCQETDYQHHRSLQNFLSGTLAGMCNGLVMNPAVSVRVRAWMMLHVLNVLNVLDILIFLTLS